MNQRVHESVPPAGHQRDQFRAPRARDRRRTWFWPGLAMDASAAGATAGVALDQRVARGQQPLAPASTTSCRRFPQGPDREDVIIDGPAPEQMLGDDAFHHRNGDTLIPGSLWIDDGNGPALTNPEAVHLAPQYLSSSGWHPEGFKIGLATPWGWG